MEHIQRILLERQKSLFARHLEKGSREWSTFNVVRGDQLELFPAAAPVPADKRPRRLKVVHITDYPRHLVPRTIH